MKVEVWSDVVCPWCYIGKRRLEAALDRFPHRDEVEVTFRSFQLDPSAEPGTTQPTLASLAAKMGRSEAEMATQMRSIEELAAAEGLRYDLTSAVSGNTLLAHQLLHLAAERGLHDTANEALLDAYFQQGRSVFDVDSLVAIAQEIGLAEDEVREALADQRYLPAVQEDIATARALGATGVPFFVVDRAYGAAGAQPPEVLLQLLERAWTASHPLVMADAGQHAGHGDGCEGGSCAI